MQTQYGIYIYKALVLYTSIQKEQREKEICTATNNEKLEGKKKSLNLNCRILLCWEFQQKKMLSSCSFLYNEQAAATTTTTTKIKTNN